MRPSLSVIAAFLALAPVALSAADKPIDFNRDVRPILSDKCFHCHGPDAHSREAELRLDVEADAKRDRDGSFVINSAKPEASLLIERIVSTDDDRMPPPELDKQLTPAEIAILKRWVAEGAVYKQAWAYEKPARHEAPAVKDQAWSTHWIDRFVLARLEEEGLTPAPDTDRVTLIRRLTFDLTGLPPTPAEVEAFVNDPAYDALEKLVDRLLASDECGERLAAYWLDLVRFADTVGYHGDQDHNASLYRDYVIDAFIANMPFDRFSREQLAGDYLDNQTDDQKIATAYNRLLQTTHEGGLQAKEYLAVYGADRVRNISGVWFGATIGCAQCHDHKFDPYTAKDFYSLQAFFADIDDERHFKEGTNTLPARRAPEIPLLSRRERQALNKLESQQRKIVEQLARLGPSPKELAEKAAQEVIAGSEKTSPASAEGQAAEDPETAAKRAALDRQLARLEKSIKRLNDSTRTVMITLHKEPRITRLLPRGNWLDDSGPETPPAIPEFMGTIGSENHRPTRLDLVNWLFDAEKGNGLLTARVFSNRFWYLAFGDGLSRSLEDFGGQGEPPSHPELLDRLAFEFVESGWDVRHMLKLMVMSRTYRQSSRASKELLQRDPENRLLARQARFRIPAEAVRDTALDLSGLLVQKVGGPSVKPYQPAGYYRHLNFPTREYKSDTETAKQWRRGVYVHWQRQFLHPMMKAFDAPTREECTVKRPRSNTPIASLVLLNDPTFVEAARAFAVRIMKQGGSTPDERIAFAFRLATSRHPDDVEAKLLRDLFATSLKEAQADPDRAEEILAVGLAKRPGNMDEVEEAAWTTVARAILNLGETYQRN
ncbi:Planctomycete cytochrome C [Caulifigura coniformis]|uniref:Planctomycete cytochrome C n=1 Tax=Caulifigura coniformis TaxID=2527983 RepID=A0A517SD21_9PLAN|nr:PSD1 and planctomycete cytochrome C domain-containing protein [Caulifigura coniformis]QDT54021.1 Planctomycete cytochrome C [Caulifigura coniformis]